MLWAAIAPACRILGLREAYAGDGVRLRLLACRRRVVFGVHAAPPTRRVDRGRSDGGSPGIGARILRSLHRPWVGRRGRRWCMTKAPCGGEKAGKSPVDRGKRGIKRSTSLVDVDGILLAAVIFRPENGPMIPSRSSRTAGASEKRATTASTIRATARCVWSVYRWRRPHVSSRTQPVCSAYITRSLSEVHRFSPCAMRSLLAEPLRRRFDAL